MTRLLLCIFLAIATSLTCKAENNEDFVGLLLSDIKTEEYTDSTGNNDFSYITIGPAMVGKVLDMMSNNKDADKDKDAEQIKKILSHIKSLRIFSAQHNIDFYYNGVISLLNKNKKTYKKYNSADKDVSCIWLRKNKDTVIEIVKLNKTDNDFKVVNFTGDMTDDFVNELLKM